MINVCILGLLTFLISYLVERKILNPTNIFILYWIIQFIMVLLFIPKEVNRYYVGYFYIISIFGILICSNIVVKKMIKVNINKNAEKKSINFRYLKQVTIIVTLLGLIYSSVKLRDSGFSVKNILNLSDLAKVTNSISINRYEGNDTAGILGQVLLSFVYLPPFLGGLILAIKPFKKYKFYTIITLLPAIVTILIQSTRATILAVVIIFISSFISFKLYEKGDMFKPINLKLLLILLVGGIGLIYLFTFLQMLRGGKVTNSLVDNSMITRMKIYFSGHLPAFSYWLENSWNPSDLTFGGYTFASIFNMLGLKSRNTGLYLDYVYLFGNSGTNIYTYFRGFIQDFGIILTYFLFFIMGILSNLAYYKTKLGHLKWTIILLFSYISILYYIVAFTNYTTYIMSIALFSIYILFFSYKNLNEKE